MDFKKIEETFKEYVDEFDFSNEKISLKYYHTLEVANISLDVAKRLHLSVEDQDLARLIGYLHDIGRFEQVEKTNTFKDTIMDHADNGVRVLFDLGLIRKFITDTEYDNIIKIAVRNHNKLKIIDEASDRERLFANIIRDSDKIDIFRVRKEEYSNEFIMQPSDIVVDTFRRGKSINLRDIKNKSDSILCVLAFIFDMNYQASLDVLREKGYYVNLLNSIKVSDENQNLFNELKDIVLKKLNGNKEDIC